MYHWPIPTAFAASLLFSCTGDDTGADDPSLIHTVSRGDLVITVRERAEVNAAENTRVTSQLEGRATLIHLIKEGSVVEKGDKIAELDSSEIEEKRASQAISVARAAALLEQARKNFEIMEKELKAAEKTAESRLHIASLRLRKFLGDECVQGGGVSENLVGTNRDAIGRLEELIAEGVKDDPTLDVKCANLTKQLVALLPAEDCLDLAMGEMANLVLVQIDEISLARADLELAKDTLFHSRRLAERAYISKNELARDEINFKRLLSQVTVAWSNLQLLIKFTLPETLITLQQEEENAQLGLESVRAANEARRVKESSELTSSEAEFELAEEQLQNWNRQVESAVIFAPTPGLVVYGRYDWDEPVYEGMDVRQRQEIVILPDVRKMIAELKVHEAQIDKVALGQPATVKVDAFPERTYNARVSHVSTLPDPQRRDRELKVFGVQVLLDVDNSDGTLRPGMNSTVSIDVGVLEDVLNVPIPALERVGDVHFVWKLVAGRPVPTPVALGSNNLTHVEILAGLEQGDRIHLVRPSGAKLPAAETLEKIEPGQASGRQAAPAAAPESAAGRAPAADRQGS